MKHCNNCNIDFNTKLKYCPFCEEELENKSETFVNGYPHIDKKRYSKSGQKRLMILSFLIGIIVTFINILIRSSGNDVLFWPIVIANILLVWSIFKITFNYHFEVTTRISLTSIIIILCFFVDEFCLMDATKKWLTIQFIIPFVSIVSLLSLIVLSFIDDDDLINSLFYILLFIGLCVILIIFIVYKGMNYYLWPSIVSISVASFTFFVLMAFHLKKVIFELKKRLHI